MIDETILQLGGTVIVTIAFIECIKVLVTVFTTKKNGVTQTDSNQQSDIAVMQKLQEIQGNDLVHIKADLEQIKVTVAEIKIHLEEKV